MHDADKRISRDTYQEGEDEAGWRPHGPWPKPHLEEKSIDLSSTSMTVPPTTTGGCPASTPELKSLFELSGVGQKNFEHMGGVNLLRARWLCSHWGAGQAPARNPTGTNSSTWCNQPRLDHRSSRHPFRGPCMWPTHSLENRWIFPKQTIFGQVRREGDFLIVFDRNFVRISRFDQITWSIFYLAMRRPCWQMLIIVVDVVWHLPSTPTYSSVNNSSSWI